MNRRRFTAGAALFGVAASVREGVAEVNSSAGQLRTTATLSELTSGTFKPQPSKTPNGPRVGHQYLLGMLKAGNIRLEMHETIQQEGAEHEAIGTHLHNEIWCVQRGTATLWINGVEHTMEAGDVGLVCAGDQHWIGNKGPGELAYFVITVGPPE